MFSRSRFIPLQNKLDEEIVPGSELIISRSVERDPRGKSDKSVYRINHATSSFTEVTRLLREKGVDLDHKRFLILQVIMKFMNSSFREKLNLFL